MHSTTHHHSSHVGEAILGVSYIQHIVFDILHLKLTVLRSVRCRSEHSICEVNIVRMSNWMCSTTHHHSSHLGEAILCVCYIQYIVFGIVYLYLTVLRSVQSGSKCRTCEVNILKMSNWMGSTTHQRSSHVGEAVLGVFCIQNIVFDKVYPYLTVLRSVRCRSEHVHVRSTL